MSEYFTRPLSDPAGAIRDLVAQAQGRGLVVMTEEGVRFRVVDYDWMLGLPAYDTQDAMTVDSVGDAWPYVPPHDTHVIVASGIDEDTDAPSQIIYLVCPGGDGLTVVVEHWRDARPGGAGWTPFAVNPIAVMMGRDGLRGLANVAPVGVPVSGDLRTEPNDRHAHDEIAWGVAHWTRMIRDGDPRVTRVAL